MKNLAWLDFLGINIISVATIGGIVVVAALIIIIGMYLTYLKDKR